ncbi:MAG: CCA tRNA nucleotidyltransferase [Cyanobacteriota bacterium]|nr:CCA tRNA nucleotidyltransferase [Cyanobacteriota bacterium]
MSLSPESSYLSPSTWPFSWDLLPQPAYLVGGAVRDALLHRKREYLDLDFVLPGDAIAIARRIAGHYNAGFVLLDRDREIARVVFDEGTADFARQEGDSLEADLRRRDFTMNAIAYDPEKEVFIDPLNGREDLEKGAIRAVSKANLKDDPLRLLRAYRQGAQLDFTIKKKTRAMLRALAPLLKAIAAERVQVELKYLLSSGGGAPWLTAAWEDGLLGGWFENAAAENLQQLERVDRCAWLLGKIWPGMEAQLHERATPQGLSWLSLAKLTCLLSFDPSIAELELEQLKYPRAEIRGAVTALKALPRLLRAGTSPLNLREQYFFFQEVGQVFPLLSVLAVVVAAQKGILEETTAVGTIAPLINRYLDPSDRAAHPTAIVTGNDLMRSLQLSPSPAIGHLLAEIQIAYLEGRVSTAEEALGFAATLLNSA